MRPGVAMTDLATGLYAHGAIMAALLQRQKTGTGSHIDCNLLSSQVLPLRLSLPAHTEQTKQSTFTGLFGLLTGLCLLTFQVG